MIKKTIKIWGILLLLILYNATVLSACSHNDNTTEQREVTSISDKMWDFSQTHPDGFTLDIRSMSEPTEGIAVSYLETQNSHSRYQLDKVIRHALSHDGYVGGWLNTENGLYYFDSTKLFPETSL
jgi:hypothetical protein